MPAGARAGSLDHLSSCLWSPPTCCQPHCLRGSPRGLGGSRTPAVVEGDQAQGPRRLQDGERKCWAEGDTAPCSWPITPIFQMGRLKTDTEEEVLKVTSVMSCIQVRARAAW